MAIASVGTLGTGASSTSNSSWTFNTATNTLSSGDFGLLTIVTDNRSTTDSNSNDHTTVSGGTGTWTKLGEYTNTVGGAAADGVCVSLWLFEATGTVSTGTTITMGLSGNATDKAASFWKFTKAAGTNIKLVTGITNPVYNVTDASNGFGSAAFSGLASAARLYFRALGKEANSTTQITVSTSFTAITNTRSRNNAAAVWAGGEFRINTSTGETSNPTLAVTGDTAGVFAALIEVTNQDLTQSSTYTNSNTLNYSHTVTPGTVTLTASLFTNDNTYYSHTLSQSGPQTITQSSTFTNSNTLTYAHTASLTLLVPSTATVFARTTSSSQSWFEKDAGRFDNRQTFYKPAVNLNLTASRYDNSNTYYAHTVTTGPVTLTASLYENSNSYYTHTLTALGGDQNLTANLYTNDPTFYTHTLTSLRTLTASRYDNSPTYYTHTLTTGPVTLTQTATYTDPDSLAYQHTVTTGPVTVTQTSRYDDADTLNYTHTLTATRALTQSARYDDTDVLTYQHTVTPGVRNLTQSSIYTDADVLNYQHTVTPGTRTLTQASRHDNSQTYYAHTISAGTTNLAAGLFTNSNTFYTHVLTPGPVTVTQSARYDNSPTYYTHTLSSGTILSAGTYNNANTFYGHTVTTGGVSLTQTQRADSTNSFYPVTLTPYYPLTPVRFDNTNTYYSHTISTEKTLTASLFTDGDTFFDHSIGGGDNVFYLYIWERTA